MICFQNILFLFLLLFDCFLKLQQILLLLLGLMKPIGLFSFLQCVVLKGYQSRPLILNSMPIFWNMSPLIYLTGLHSLKNSFDGIGSLINLFYIFYGSLTLSKSLKRTRFIYNIQLISIQILLTIFCNETITDRQLR